MEKIIFTNLTLKKGKGGGGVLYTLKNLIYGLRSYYDCYFVGFPYDMQLDKYRIIIPIRQTDLSESDDADKGKKSLKSRVLNLYPLRKLLIFSFMHFKSARNRLIKRYELDADIVVSNSIYDDVLFNNTSNFNITFNKIIFIQHDPYKPYTKEYVERIARGRPFMIVSINKTDYNRKVGIFKKEHARLVHTGVDIKPRKLDSNFIKSLNLQGKKVIFSVGRLFDKQKGFSLGIKAMNLLKDKHPDLVYLIGGGGIDRVKYEKLIYRYNLGDKVKLLGFTTEDQKYSLLKRADIILLPSPIETLGLTTIEAMHFGKPIITLKNEGSIDLIKDGYNGFFTGKNGKNIADKIEKTLSLDKTKLSVMRRNSLKMVSQFTIKQQVEKFDGVIKELISQNL
ncbi:glycosyltransferase family 4 protein [Candidatus Parvarchaeota archaeon]|nr:glycosyltransferase family 4 protein [Candidatus Acidifodinimicrobium mancum]